MMAVNPARRATVTAGMSMLGNSTLMVNTSDSTTRIPMMRAVTTLSHIRLTQGPSTPLSLQSRRRNNEALGNRTPARIWT
jgi:hypothetical protein